MASLFSSFASLVKPKDIEFVEAKDLKFGDLQNGILPLYITLVLKNPNNLSAKLRSLGFALFCWDVKIGEADQLLEREIEGNAIFDILLNLDINATEVKEILKNHFVNIITDGSVKTPLEIKGKATIRKFGFDFDVPFNIKREFELHLKTLLDKIKL